MGFASSKVAFGVAFGIVFVNFILFVIALAGDWQCWDGYYGQAPFCTKLTDKVYQSDFYDSDSYRASLAFNCLAFTTAFALGVLLVFKLVSLKTGISQTMALVYFLLSLAVTIFSVIMWSIFISVADTSVFGEEWGYGLICGVTGSVLSLYPLIYTAALYFGDIRTISAQIPPPAPVWKYSAVRRSIVAP